PAPRSPWHTTHVDWKIFLASAAGFLATGGAALATGSTACSADSFGSPSDELLLQAASTRAPSTATVRRERFMSGMSRASKGPATMESTGYDRYQGPRGDRAEERQ